MKVIYGPDIVNSSRAMSISYVLYQDAIHYLGLLGMDLEQP